MDNELQEQDIIKKARLDTVDKFSVYLMAEEALARQANGFFDRKYWKDLITAKKEWQKSSNEFYTLLHELAK